METKRIDNSLSIENNFRVVVSELPNVQFFMQDMPIPEISVNQVDFDASHARILLQDNIIDWGPINLSFQVDEYWFAYEEVFTWLYSMGNPMDPEKRDGLRFADITITCLDNNLNGFMDIVFVDAFPINLGGPVWTTTGEATFLSADCIMQYQRFELKRTRFDVKPPQRRIPDDIKTRLKLHEH